MNPDAADFEARQTLAQVDRAHVRARHPATPRPPATTQVGVLDRAVQILDVVRDGARGLPAIRDRTGLSRSTAHRLVGALEEHGFLFHVGGFGYALGPRLLGLAATAMRVLPLRELARPALESLARTTGESAQLYVRDGDRRVCVDSVQSDRELRTIVEVGASLPLDRGSAGHVFLAWGADAGLDLDDDTLKKVIATRRRGWSHSHGEREPGVASVSAPVFGPGGMVLGAVSLSGPASRILPLRAKDFAPAVLDAAAKIRDAVGATR